MRLTLPLAILLCLAQIAAAQQRQVSVVRELRIDGVAANLVNPGWILVGTDGRIVASQPEDNGIAVFGASGSLLGKFGMRGDGPGEFRSVASAGWLGDSLWVYDILARRTTIVSPGLTFGRVVAIAGAKPAAGAESTMPKTEAVTPLAFFADGSLLMRAKINPANAPARYDTSGYRIFRINGEGTILTHVAHVNVPSGSVTVADGGRFMVMTVPLFARPLLRTASRGGLSALLSVVYEGPLANNMRVVVFRSSGDTVYSRHYPFTPERIPRTVADSLADRVVSAMATSASPEMLRRARQQIAVPPVRPPFTDMLVSDDGVVWIALSRSGDAPRRFMILNARGDPAGTLTLPANLTPMAVSATHFWGVEKDTDDVPSIVRYRIVP